MKKNNVYKIIFIQLGEIYEVFANQIYQSDMYGFIEVEDYIFNKDKQLVVDPTSEKLKNEFSQVQRSYIPMNAIIRIDEVNETGDAKIKENNDNNNVVLKGVLNTLDKLDEKVDELSVIVKEEIRIEEPEVKETIREKSKV